VIETDLTIATPSGRMGTTVFRPSREEPRPVVVMLMDGQGISEAVRDNARMLAAAGYYVLLPNLYYRAGRASVMDEAGNLLPDLLREMNAALSPATIAEDVGACIGHAGGEAAAKPGPVGLIGYCLGGRLSLWAADALGEAVAAVVSLHPGFLATERAESPHRHVAGIKAEVYIGAAEQDPYLKPGMAETMAAALEAAGVRATVEVLPGSHHGYALPGRPTYHRPSALAAWEQAFDLFGRCL
jgi:carboxymethylenebutenolidase